MFNVIEAQEHHLYESTIHRFVRELQIAVNLKETQELTNAIYILMGDQIKEFQGGVLLLKQPLEDVAQEIRIHLEGLYPQYQPCSEIWTGRIAFQVSEDISGADYERLSKILYRTLFEDLVAFSVKEKTPFLYLMLPLVEHLSIDMLGLWPYLLRVSPSESTDGLFHGILSLIKTKENIPSLSSLEKAPDNSNLFTPQNRDKIITS